MLQFARFSWLPMGALTHWEEWIWNGRWSRQRRGGSEKVECKIKLKEKFKQENKCFDIICYSFIRLNTWIYILTFIFLCLHLCIFAIISRLKDIEIWCLPMNSLVYSFLICFNIFCLCFSLYWIIHESHYYVFITVSGCLCLFF